MIKINPVPNITIIVPNHAPIEGIFFVKIQSKNNIIIGLVDERVATIPASPFCSEINSKLIPKAIPKKPLIIIFIIIVSEKLTLILNKLDFDI